VHLFCGLNQLNIFLEQAIDEAGHINTLGLGAGTEVLLYLGIEVDRRIDLSAWPEELATLATGEVDLAGHIVILWIGLRTHGVHLSRFVLVLTAFGLGGLAR
jgi:hypothetical protein